MSDAIRAALEAAGAAVVRVQGYADETTHDAAAAAIAAFHTRIAEQHESQAAWFEAGRHRAIAAAVEAAAKEGER